MVCALKPARRTVPAPRRAPRPIVPDSLRKVDDHPADMSLLLPQARMCTPAQGVALLSSRSFPESLSQTGSALTRFRNCSPLILAPQVVGILTSRFTSS